MHAYLAGACRNLDSPSLRVGGTADHVHVLCRLSRKIAIADLVIGANPDACREESRRC